MSRYLLLKKLADKGIGNCMLQNLKRLYSYTLCILTYGKEFSKRFRTYSGIRQGLASSVLLFIAFVDDLIDYLKDKCTREPIIDDTHCLLHADDTAILSTNRDLFIIKCNHMLHYFNKNSLSLNLSKSGFIVIDPMGGVSKADITLENGRLEYKPVITYLGAIISDTGSVDNDVDREEE